MSQDNQIVTVCNRSSKPLLGTWDGRHYDIPPYPEVTHLPRIAAIATRFQNPINGVGTPMEDWSVKSEYLIGIKELGDDCSPMEQSNAPQRWNTEELSGPDAVLIRPRGAGLMTDVRQPQPKLPGAVPVGDSPSFRE